MPIVVSLTVGRSSTDRESACDFPTATAPRLCIECDRFTLIGGKHVQVGDERKRHLFRGLFLMLLEVSHGETRLAYVDEGVGKAYGVLLVFGLSPQ